MLNREEQQAWDEIVRTEGPLSTGYVLWALFGVALLLGVPLVLIAWPH